ncbi:CLUMA_CG017545, isoform A [Clunio marinus]|uniref:CLUMA_CG017545, isoform A n=1 Tax=Clunio marinus TaxID=568069 RepID=A0A1J1IZ66_9DIPT|nr:CLUMA_CG017545, isoform A [Clunio marinus]
MDYGNNENRFNSNRSYNRDGGDGGGHRSNFSASERSVIQIPGTHIGKIIGPAGRHINDMQRQYNVRIQINKMANSDGTKDAEISGNNINDIQDAIKAINEQIDAPFERRGGGGGGGSRYNDGPHRFGGQRDGDRNYGDRSGGFSRGREDN